MSANPFPTDPRTIGILEQYARAQFFLGRGLAWPDAADRFRYFMAAVYFSRAIAEIMLEAAVKGVVKVERAEVEKIILSLLPRYMLLEKIRIHDFHRFGVVQRSGWTVEGPIKLTASAGEACLSITLGDSGPGGGRVATTAGNSRIQEQRPLQLAGDRFLDEESGKYLTLDQILSDYLAGVPALAVLPQTYAGWPGSGELG